ncbi:uncharacterized mitochondrial protein AtMg00810-like [Rutidosis leptorrhynchoides]|uniref:uncharacterized mitochondrial protein AtMg00810-like n=1 Tax=Rutidosis leptorrhynchoides TaxID=125765 RepID=UPI003A98FF70
MVQLKVKKVRLVVHGNRQRKVVDYAETFAHVAKMVTVSSLLAVAAIFEQSNADYSLFTKRDSEQFTAILVYVDDLSITGNSPVHIEILKSQLNSSFQMKYLGTVSYFLGPEVSKLTQGIFISQKTYTPDLLKKAEVINMKPYKLPLDQHVKLNTDLGTPLSNIEMYR